MGPRAMEFDEVGKVPVRSYRVAVATAFFFMGAVFGSWVSRIPAIQRNTELSTGALSLALVAGSLTGMAAMSLTGALAERYGSRRVTQAAMLILCITLPLPGLAFNLSSLAAALIAFNVGFGMMEVGVNAEAVRVEQMAGRRIMSSLHGLFSVGGMAGAAAGGWAAARGVDAPRHLFATGGALLIIGMAAGFRLPPSAPRPTAPGPRRRRGFQLPRRALVGLGVIALCGLVAEGAMGDWTALYLVRMLDTAPGPAALGFAAFSMCMAGARLLGDRVAHHVGASVVVRGGAILSAAALALALVSAQAWLAIACFGFVGIGLAVIVPLAYSAAGAVPGIPPSRAIASVATVGSFGFLIGPPIIGFMAELSNLRIALALLIPLCVVIALLAGRLETGGNT